MDKTNRLMYIFKKYQFMDVDGDKIKKLIALYGKDRGYAEKSYVAMFCEDWELNYNQWNAYTRGAQKAGIKIIHQLMDVFPDLNLNWLLKDVGDVFISGKTSIILNEPPTKYNKTVTNSEIINKLDDILTEIKKTTSSKQE
jgi:hypothetical protein